MNDDVISDIVRDIAVLGRTLVAKLFFSPYKLNDFLWISPSLIHDLDARAIWAETVQTHDIEKVVAVNDAVVKVSDWYQDERSILTEGAIVDELLRLSQLVRAYEGCQKIFFAIRDRSTGNLESALTNLTESVRGGVSNLETILDVTNVLSDMLEHIGDTSVTQGVMKTLIGNLDKSIVGIMPGTLSVLAARTSIGKTQMALQISRNIVMQGKRVLYVSTESDAKTLMLRMSLGEMRVPMGDYFRGLDEINQSLLASVMGHMMHRMSGKYFIDDSAVTLAKIGQEVAEIKPDFVVVDHLEEVAPDQKGVSRVEWLETLTRGLRNIAKGHNCHVMAIHQLSRGAEGEPDEDSNQNRRKPMLRDLRWSGAIEQIADLVIMLHRVEIVVADPQSVPTEVWVRKNRFGQRDECVELLADMLAGEFIDDIDLRTRRRAYYQDKHKAMATGAFRVEDWKE